jgi:hypothetical protein
VRARADRDADIERVAADQAAWWMYQHVMADRIAFGIQASQDAQRAIVLEPGHAAMGLQKIVELQSGVPRHTASVPQRLKKEVS